MKKRTKKTRLHCDNCGKEGAIVRKISRTYGKGSDIFVIQNIPAVMCPHCEANYMTAETLHELERMKLHRKSLAVKRTVPVAQFV